MLSGGSGTRLWPLSTPERPKQFVPLFGGRSLFDLTLARLGGVEGMKSPIVATGSAHTGLVEEAMTRADIGEYRILVEPTGRNTAPAAIAAALVTASEDVLFIVPSDHLITDTAGFQRAVAGASRNAAEGGIVTFGIKPTGPETGYGYIEIGDPHGGEAFDVRRFKEKPDAERAEEMVADGRHVWNSGMFIARSDHLLEEAAIHCPDIVEGVRAALPGGEATVVQLADSFAEVEANSIDYAILEKTEHAFVIPVDIGWDDVGSYQSLLTAMTRDSDGNHVEGDVIANEVTGSFIKASSRKVAVAGMDEVVVVETPDAVLVAPLDRSKDVRDIARQVDFD